ncbi:MAG: hypothetical protein AB1453_04315 [Chloroflexota bacterium]|jgi:hypothetical protein
METRSRFTSLTLRVILILFIAAAFTTTLTTLLFSPPYPASAANLPAIHSRLQANYLVDVPPEQIIPLEMRLVDQVND